MKAKMKIYCTGWLLSLLAFNHSIVAQPKPVRNVAIFVWDGAELLDFSGPGEVFSAAGYNTYTVSVDGKEIISQRFVTIKPQFSMDTCPPPDVIVLPGGGTSPISKNGGMLEWIKKQHQQGAILLSVCTGAMVLNSAALLDGKTVTTHYSTITRLRELNPSLNVMDNTRWVDNGTIITTAGVSAGIDGALHLVSRLKGLDQAKSTARYMEYDKWKPGEGKIIHTNDFISQLQKQLLQPEWNSKKIPPIPSGKDVPYEGELKNLARMLIEQNKIEEAAKVYEITTQIYPHSGAAYLELNKLYRKLNRPAPTDEETLTQLLINNKGQEAIDQIHLDLKKFKNWILFDENNFTNLAASHYFEKGDYNTAFQLFKLIADAYPGFSSYYNLAETYQKINKHSEALLTYKKALTFNPSDSEVQKIIKELEQKNQE